MLILYFYLIAPILARNSVEFLSSRSVDGKLEDRSFHYQIDKSIFNQQSQLEDQSSSVSYSFEMELHCEKEVYQDYEILFTAKLGRTATLTKENQIQTDFADMKGYQMKKKYFRLVLENAYVLSPQNLFISIINMSDLAEHSQKQLSAINFSISIQETNIKGVQKCPFDCLQNGICNTSTGKCSCKRGYFDEDCSLIAIDFSSSKRFIENEDLDYRWNIMLSKKDRQQFFFVERDDDQKQFVYLHIQQNQENNHLSYHNPVEIYYGSQIISLREDQLNQEEEYEIFLEKFLKTSHSSEQTFTLVGFRLGGSILDEEEEDAKYTYSVSLFFTSIEPDSFLYTFIFTIKFIVYAICGTLICLTFFLLFVQAYFFCRMKFYLISERRTQLLKKDDKEREEKYLLTLLPAFPFNQQLQEELKLKQQNNEDPICSVCLCEFQEGDQIRKTYCPHYFHAECLQLWLKKQQSCPHCRNPLTPEKVKEKQPFQSPLRLQPLQNKESLTAGDDIQNSQNNDSSMKKLNNSGYFNQFKRSDSGCPMIVIEGNLSRREQVQDVPHQSPQTSQSIKVELFISKKNENCIQQTEEKEEQKAQHIEHLKKILFEKQLAEKHSEMQEKRSSTNQSQQIANEVSSIRQSYIESTTEPCQQYKISQEQSLNQKELNEFLPPETNKLSATSQIEKNISKILLLETFSSRVYGQQSQSAHLKQNKRQSAGNMHLNKQN